MLTDWTFSIAGEVDEPKRWTWDEFRQLPSETITRDSHCLTKWSKLDPVWQAVSVDTLLEGVDTSAEYVMAFSDVGPLQHGANPDSARFRRQRACRCAG